MSVHFRHSGADEFYPQAQVSTFSLTLIAIKQKLS